MRTKPFDDYSSEYDKWFDKNKYVYLSEREAVKFLFSPASSMGYARGSLYRPSGKAVDIGAGTGRFLIPLNIKFAVEPSAAMLDKLVKKTGVYAARAIAEKLPFKDNKFDTALLVTTICFVDDASASLNEIKRILKPGGRVIIGFVDKNSPLGGQYIKNKDKSRFYAPAVFYSAEDVISLVQEQGFKNIRTVQTVFGNIKQISSVQNFKDGYGEGGFIALSAEK